MMHAKVMKDTLPETLFAISPLVLQVTSLGCSGPPSYQESYNKINYTNQNLRILQLTNKSKDEMIAKKTFH